MLKWLAIVAIVLASVGSPKPIPGKTANGDSQSAQQPKNQNYPGKSPPAPVPAILQKDCGSDQFKNDPDCKKEEEKPTAIEISKLPTANVTVQRTPERDKFDWIAYGFSIALAVRSEERRVGKECRSRW